MNKYEITILTFSLELFLKTGSIDPILRNPDVSVRIKRELENFITGKPSKRLKLLMEVV